MLWLGPGIFCTSGCRWTISVLRRLCSTIPQKNTACYAVAPTFGNSCVLEFDERPPEQLSTRNAWRNAPKSSQASIKDKQALDSSVGVCVSFTAGLLSAMAVEASDPKGLYCGKTVAKGVGGSKESQVLNSRNRIEF